MRLCRRKDETARQPSGCEAKTRRSAAIFSFDPGITESARLVLTAFLITFTLTRSLVLLMASGKVRNRFLDVGGTHVHHLNYGIFLLAGVGGFLIFGRPGGLALQLATIVYGIGMALTFDEFGMWLHLEDNYWQRASWDAVAVVASLFGLIAFAPSIRSFRLPHWVVTGTILFALCAYIYMLALSYRKKKGR